MFSPSSFFRLLAVFACNSDSRFQSGKEKEKEEPKKEKGKKGEKKPPSENKGMGLSGAGGMQGWGTLREMDGKEGGGSRTAEEKRKKVGCRS